MSHNRLCAGYNFKKNSTDDQVNCQLTDTGKQTFERKSDEDNNWTFYKIAGKRIVRARILCYFKKEQ